MATREGGSHADCNRPVSFVRKGLVRSWCRTFQRRKTDWETFEKQLTEILKRSSGPELGDWEKPPRPGEQVGQFIVFLLHRKWVGQKFSAK